MTRRVYLDHNASTPVHPEVVAAMLPYFSEIYGNPSSVHGFGRDARSAVDAARERVAGFLRVRADELVFTSGGTESDNFGLKGLALARGRGHLITSTIEHHAVLRSAQALEAEGFAVSYLPVDSHGMVDPDDVRRALPERGAKLFVCAYGCQKRRVPLDHADLVTYCGLVVLTDLINATERFIALN